jgi:hypothetical protein
MRTFLLAATLLAACGTETESAPSVSRSAETSSACTFNRAAGCGSTDCCEFDSTAYPGYREEYVCCGGTSALVMRICSCPSCKTPCGKAGPNGCAICEHFSYSVSCNVHPQEQPGQPQSCGYVIDGVPGGLSAGP